MASEHHDRCFDENWKNANHDSWTSPTELLEGEVTKLMTLRSPLLSAMVHPKYLMNYDIEDVYLKNTIKRGLTGFLNCLVCLWLWPSPCSWSQYCTISTVLVHSLPLITSTMPCKYCGALNFSNIWFRWCGGHGIQRECITHSGFTLHEVWY